MQVPTSQLASLERLEELKLGNNYFVSLPSRAFRGLRKLRSLDLSDCPKLRSVSSSALADNDNLASLSLSGCRELQPDSIQVKIFQLVGQRLQQFRNDLIREKTPNNIEEFRES